MLDLYSLKHGELCQTLTFIYLNNKRGKMYKLSINIFAGNLKQNTSVYSIKYYWQRPWTVPSIRHLGHIHS